jgi:hypothetical protein
LTQRNSCRYGSEALLTIVPGGAQEEVATERILEQRVLGIVSPEPGELMLVKTAKFRGGERPE